VNSLDTEWIAADLAAVVGRDVVQPLRFALTGRTVGLGLYDGSRSWVASRRSRGFGVRHPPSGLTRS
jgi:hypothetical protein